MEEGHAVTPGSRPDPFLHGAEASALEAVQGPLQVRDPEGHVVESRAVSGQKAAHGGVRVPGLQELDGAHEGDVDSLEGELFDRGTGFAGHEFEEDTTLFDGLNRHGDVIEGMGRHGIDI